MTTIIPTVLEQDRDVFLSRFRDRGVLELANMWQVDVIDGSYGDAIAFSDGESLADQQSALSLKAPALELDLMTRDPLRHIKVWQEQYPNVQRVIIHLEAVLSKAEPILAELKETYPELELGIALSHTIPLTSIAHLAEDITHLQLMGVPIGRSGQPFIGEPVLEKIKAARYEYPELIISVDGGVKGENALDLIQAGAQQLSINSGLWKTPSPKNTLKHLQTL